jgi:hypothetical protein
VAVFRKFGFAFAAACGSSTGRAGAMAMSPSVLVVPLLDFAIVDTAAWG